MPLCLNCNEILNVETYGSAIVYKCPRCGAFYDETPSQRPLIELLNESDPESQQIIRDVSKKCCQSIIQYLTSRIDKSLVEMGVIPIIWGTTSRMLYSPLSDIDIVFIVPEAVREKAYNQINEFRVKIATEEIRLKNLIDRTTLKRIPRSISQKKVPFSMMRLLEGKLRNNILNGACGKAKPFQPPQMILLSSALPLANPEKFCSFRSELLEKYRELADSNGFLLEHLASGLYSYNALAHIYYGRENHYKFHSLPIPPKFLLREFGNPCFKKDWIPDFKSLDFREWQMSQGNPMAIDNGTKVLYRCVCDFLFSINLLCYGSFEDLLKSETFDAVQENRGFDSHERLLFFLVQKWRLGALPNHFNRLWQVAALVANVFFKKINLFNLEDEIKLAKKLFIESPAIDYEN